MVFDFGPYFLLLCLAGKRKKQMGYICPVFIAVLTLWTLLKMYFLTNKKSDLGGEVKGQLIFFSEQNALRGWHKTTWVLGLNLTDARKTIKCFYCLVHEKQLHSPMFNHVH